MWRHKQHGFALRLLCELQKQQQCSLHCDTLLQTEGVSIPAHSCVLSALSPVFCRAFSNAPSLPVGQSRLIQLEAVGAPALMKLVGFMYSGDIEGENLEEKQEVIDIACRLGFSNFIEEKCKQVNRHTNKTAGWREIGLQTEETGRKKDASVQMLSKKPHFSHSGTQTDSTETHFADTCTASEPEMSIGLPEELTDIPSEYNSISPDTGLAWIDELVAHTPSNSSEVLFRAQAKQRQTQKENKKARNTKKHRSTQLSLKIKLKRQRSEELWEIVSVQEESTVDESKTFGSSDDPTLMHSLAETSVEVRLSPSSLLTCQTLEETVALTPPSELTTPLPSSPIGPHLDNFCFHAPDPVPLSSILQMQPLSPDMSQPGESDEHSAKLLKKVTVGLNISPSLTAEGNSSTPAHLDKKLEERAAVANSPTSYLCLPGHTLGAMETGTVKPSEAGPGGESGCKTWDLENAASVANNPTLFSSTSPCMIQKKNIDSLFTLPCSMTNIVPAKLAFVRKGLEHQNVNELKTVLNHIFWGSATDAQSGKHGCQSVMDASEDRNIQTKQPAGLDDPPPVGQCPENIVVTDQVSVWQSSDDTLAPNSADCADFCEMRLPRCLSPLASEAGITTGISTQDPLRPLKFSSCLSPSHVNLQPALRYTSSPSQPQALPGKTNQHNSSCTSQHVNDLNFLREKKNSYLLRSNGDPLKGATDNMLDRPMNKLIVGDRSTAMHNLEADNEPCRKKAKMTGYPTKVDAVEKTIPCSVRLKKLRHIESIQDFSNPVIFDTMNCLKAAKTQKRMTIDQKPESQMSQASKCNDQDVCQKDAWDTKQPSSLASKRELVRPLQKGTCTKDMMESLSKNSELNSSTPVHNSSSSSHHDLHVTQTNRDFAKRFLVRDRNRRPMNVQHRPLGLAQNITKVKDVISECVNNSPKPEMNTPSVEPEKVMTDGTLNKDENKRSTMYSSLAKKKSVCDKIFHQTVFSLGTSVTTQHLPINHQLKSNLQTTDKQIRTSLPPSLISEKISKHPETDHVSVGLMMDKNKLEKKDTTEESGKGRDVPMTDKPDGVLNKFKDNKVDLKNKAYSQNLEKSCKNVKGCSTSGNFVKQAEISVNTGLSIHNPVDLKATSHLRRIPPVKDFNNNYGIENHLKLTSTTLPHPSRAENMMEKPKRGEQITGPCAVPISNNPTEVKLIKTKDLHSEGTGSTRNGNMERQEVITTGGIIDDEKEKSQISVLMDNNGPALVYEKKINGQQVSRTEAEILPPEEATVEITSEMINTEEFSISHEEPDSSSFSGDTVGPSSAFLLESAEDHSSADEELVVDDACDSPVQLWTVAHSAYGAHGTQCNIILDEKDEWRENDDDDDEEEEVDVTGEESN